MAARIFYSILLAHLLLLFIIGEVLVVHGDVQEDSSAKSIPVTKNSDTDTMTEEEKSKFDSSKEKYEYQAEVNRLMDIIINSLYTVKDVFLRELISNAADALEKNRFLAITEKSKSSAEQKLEIRIDFDREGKTISIMDTGVGMTKHDLINNLGTVAKSGTTNFLEALGQGADVNLIGQFGVGFYAAFLVADRVTVTSKHDDDEQYIWESSADGSFTVAKDPRGNTLNRGTKVTLHLKEDATEFLNDHKLKDLASNYGKFISFPIYLKVEKTVTEEVPEEEETIDQKEGDETKKEKKTKKVEKKMHEWERVNPDKAIWLKPKEEVDEKQYNEFYKSISKDWADPLAYVHFKAEGEIEFKSILFIPSRAPADMFGSYFSTQANIKLYVRRAFVGDKFENLLPQYLHFVTGVVSSEDLPLNVSREQLQQSKLIGIISKRLVKKSLEVMQNLSKDSEAQKQKQLKKAEEEKDEAKKQELIKAANEETKFHKFWKEYSKWMKLGCYEDDANRSKVAKIMRFYTSKSGDQQISLDKYVQNSPDSQKVIYYISGESPEQLMENPNMQIFLKKNIEVLFLTEAMDEPCIQKLTDFEGRKFTSVGKGDGEIAQTDEEKKRQTKLKKMYDPLLKWLQQQLSSKVQKVELSLRLVEAPCAVVAFQWGYSAHMEKLMKSQTFADASQVRMMSSQKIFEINPNHPVITNLLGKIKADPNDGTAKQIANKLFQGGMVASGFDIENPDEVANIVYESVSKSLGIDPQAEIKEIDLTHFEDEEESSEPVDESADDEETEDLDAENEEDVTIDDKNSKEAAPGGKEKMSPSKSSNETTKSNSESESTSAAAAGKAGSKTEELKTSQTKKEGAEPEDKEKKDKTEKEESSTDRKGDSTGYKNDDNKQESKDNKPEEL